MRLPVRSFLVVFFQIGAGIVNMLHSNLGPVAQSIVSLTSSLVVKMLTVLVSTISYLQVFLLKNVSSF